MSHLPPLGWGDVATKHDLADARGELRLEMESMEHRLRAEIQRVARGQLIAYTTITAFLNVSLVAALKLA